MNEEKDPFLKQHSERVANNSANFCEEFKIFDDEMIWIKRHPVLGEKILSNLKNKPTGNASGRPGDPTGYLVDFAELQSAQILKIAPETIESIGEELKQILQDVAHLF